ncbi:uncharacterized protein LOC130283830 isoform X2 [Hyla sarda]|uniref:uncharacterized protein LOC130283830 isoform X2 n=1 Tax=Hyla sarda TaxID=327740 RepID=UPI0024C40BAF|nr:uncharacterized protein LOC130283830 isoform X2 [Hyla sarda]
MDRNIEVKVEQEEETQKYRVTDRNPPERCPRPLYSQDCLEGNFPEIHQAEDLMDIKIEIKDEPEEETDFGTDQQYGVIDRNPPERCPRPLYSQDCPEGNVPEKHQGGDLTNNKVEDEEERMRGHHPCMREVREEIPGGVTPGCMMSSDEEVLFGEELNDFSSPSPEQVSESQPFSTTTGTRVFGKKLQKRSAPSRNREKASKRSKYEKHAVDPTNFDTEDVINLVRERTSLWDRADPKHADIWHNKKKWLEIYKLLFPEFQTYGTQLQEVIKILVQKRWRSVRDRFFKSLRESNLPSGSGTSKRTTYKYATQLSFLVKVQGMKKRTSSNTAKRMQERGQVEQVLVRGQVEQVLERGQVEQVLERGQVEQVLERGQVEQVLERGQVEQVLERGQLLEVLEIQPATEEQSRAAATIASGLRSALQKCRASRRSRRESERDKLIVDTIQKLEEEFNSKFLHQEVRLLRLEGLVHNQGPNECRDFLMSLVPAMEQMTEEQRLYFRGEVLKLAHECLYPPPTPMSPPTSPSI